MIELKGVKKSFNDQVVIENFNLVIPEGQVHILLGASGSGKTTLLRMIGGLSQADAGDVLVMGKEVSDYGQRERTTKLAYITQEGGLFPHMTGEENILLPARVRHKDLSDHKKRMQRLAQMVDLELSLLQKHPHELSGGQRQRVALMRGLILDPQIVLMDEPLSALDPIVRSSLQQELKEIFKNLKKTVIMVTHDIQEASFLGDEITLLNLGRAIQTSSFSDLYHNPKDPFVHEFLRAQIPLGIEL